MSRAAAQVAQEIVDALQGRIEQWQAERTKIEVIREKQDRKEERYTILGDLIAAAQAEILSASKKISADQVGVSR